MKNLHFCLTAFCGLAMSTGTFAQDFCSGSHSGTSVKTTRSWEKENIGEHNYEIWYDGGSNSAQFYSDGSFSCTFSGTKDYLCREGQAYDKTKTWQELGHLYADFSVKKSNLSGIGYSYIGIYGWSVSPQIEYYIVDDWGTDSEYPPGGWMTFVADITVDGAAYKVYTHEQVNQPAVEGDANGNATFMQYFSIRQKRRSCGTIDITAHFTEWDKLGLKLGKMYEAKVLGEAGNGNGGASGAFDFNYAKVYVSDAPVSSSTSTASSSASVDRAPYSSNSAPGKIEFENYDKGGDGVAYSGAKAGKVDYAVATMRPEDDVDVISVGSGYGVGNIQPNQWMEYTVNVSGTGKYSLTVNAAKGNEGDSKVTLLVDGSEWSSATVVGDATDESWSNYKNYKSAVSAQLTAGEHVIRVVFQGYVNVDWFELSADGELEMPSSSSESGGSSSSIVSGESSSSSINVAGSSSSAEGSSASMASSSSVSANSSSSATAVTGIANIHLRNSTDSFLVFDMQGKFLGKVGAVDGVNLSESIKARFHKAGAYIVKQGSAMHRVNVR